MPGINAPADDWWAQRQQQMGWQLRALSHQQNYTCSDAQGRPVINMGLIPGSNPAAYGMQVVNPVTGQQVMFAGEDGSGNAFQAFYTTGGQRVVQLDANGLRVYDASGNLRVALGVLPSGDYGIQTLDPSGNSREVLPTYQAFVELNPSTNAVWTTTSTTESSPNGGPSVSAYFGASGDALITASATMWISAGNGAYLTLAVDGVAVGSYPILYSLVLGSVSCSVKFQLSKFPGMATVAPNSSHNVSFLISTASGGATASFQGLGLSVEPI